MYSTVFYVQLSRRSTNGTYALDLLRLERGATSLRDLIEMFGAAHLSSHRPITSGAYDVIQAARATKYHHEPSLTEKITRSRALKMTRPYLSSHSLSSYYAPAEGALGDDARLAMDIVLRS